MTRKALLIGAEPSDLAGVRNDIKAMAETLARRDFRITKLVTPKATRAAILTGYEKLIANAQSDDAYVVYYSGHGGLAKSPTGPDLQFIAPDDYGRSDENDFRGITNVELSVLLARLTEVAPNTTVILDCCHAAHQSRQVSGLRVKSLLRPAHWLPSYETVERHIARLVEEGLPVQLRPLVSNPSAVRVVACAPIESAYEVANRDGVVMGLFTDALCRALDEADGLRLNWSTLIDSVRQHVQLFADTQRPEVEGPSERQPFETSVLDPLGTLPVVAVESDRIQLLGAPLLSVEVGDQFAIMPAEAANPQDGPPIGTATVDRVLPTMALAQLRLSTAGQKVPVDARAHRTSAAAAALPVRLPSDGPAAARLAKAVELRPLVRQTDPGTDASVTVEVIADQDGRLVVRDAAGPLHSSYPATPDGVDSIVANLQRIAQATALRRLSGDPARPLDHQVVLEWGRVRNYQPEPLPVTGAMLFAKAKEQIYLRVHNQGDQLRYVSLVDVGVSYRIKVLTGSDLGGVRLAPGSSYTFGWDDTKQRLVGAEMSWPDGIDTTVARPETVVALISDGPVDVSVLQQRGVRRAKQIAPTRLGRLLDQVVFGGSRELGDASSDQVRFDIQQIDFTLSPTAPPVAERAAFLIDDRPELPVRMLSARDATPVGLAVRIDELIVHRNRAMGAADIRVDAIVLTGGAGEQPAYRTQTMRFSNIGDECRLPLDSVLIYHGPAVDFLDIAVWVSRDQAGSRSLGDLLEQRLPELRVAANTVTELTMAVAPQAGPAVAAAVSALSAGAVLVNTAYQLLTGVAGRSIGLYRTSLLAQEQFGTGQHRRHPQDFSFTFSIAPVT